LGCPLAQEGHEQDKAGSGGETELKGDVLDHGRVEPSHEAAATVSDTMALLGRH
jgi:hypothetical protein